MQKLRLINRFGVNNYLDINFDKSGLKYFGPFITLPLSLKIGFPSMPSLLIFEFCTSSKHLSNLFSNY